MGEEGQRVTGISSRIPAFLAGTLVPLVLGVAGIVFALGMSAMAGAPFRQAGPFANMMVVLPGALVLGSLIAVPVSASLVVSMSWLMRRTRHADRIVAWTIAGPVFSLPVALLFWSFDPPGTVPVCLLSGLALGLVGGLAAGIRRPRPERRNGAASG